MSTEGQLTKQQELQAKRNLMGLAQAGRFAEANALAQKLVQLLPEDVELWNALGQIQVQMGKPYEAMHCFARVASRPSKLKLGALSWLTDLCLQHGKEAEGLPFARELVSLSPKNADSHSKLGRILNNQNCYEEAKSCFQEAIKLDPKETAHKGWNAVNQIFLGECEEAIDYLKTTLGGYSENAIKQGQADPSLYILQAGNYVDGIDEEEVFQSHKAYSAAKSRPAASVPLHSFSILDHQRLKVGIVTSDFNRHSVAYFLEPLLEHYDNSKWELYIYSDTAKYDETSARLKPMVEVFRHTREADDKSLADQISQDGIHVLIDLVAFLGKIRLGTFAQRPAPIQVTYLAYPNTTGLEEMDYRLTDAWCDPVGQTDRYYTEKLVRLPKGFLCFRPDDDAPEVTELPAIQNGFLTFGSFNIFQKISQRNFELWAQVLKSLPDSRLLLKSRPLGEQRLKLKVEKRFEELGVDKSRVTILGWTKEPGSHLEYVNSVDIHLDTFPYNGTTTTCQALWQGVPTLTLVGDTHRSRVGYSLMTQIGLEDWAAYDEQAFVERAQEKAKNIDSLASLRSEMRARIAKHALGNPKLFVEQLEQAFDEMVASFNESSV